MTQTIATICMPRHRGFLAGLLALLLLPAMTVAQTSGTIKGRVFDRETGDPMPFANVVLLKTSFGSATDVEGRFTLTGIPAGTYKIRVSYIGYSDFNGEITVSAGATTTQEYRLTSVAITGETVVVTAQAQGQNAAINQQLASNTISNVVSAARIKEVPDVNAAESIGRLPGVSISRSGGEATQVSIRGLSAKYNTVTVNGVALPATGGDDRAVDLSLVSSNMIDGIELKKANTPDMDADALGGSVDLRLREAPDGFNVGASAQAGYNKLQNYRGNFNLSVNVSNRFLDGDLGVMAAGNMDNYDRSADKMSGSYRQELQNIVPSGMSLREERVTKRRAGGSLLLDYRIPDGKVTANVFYTRFKNYNDFRINRMDREHNSHYYDLQNNQSTTSIFTGTVGARQDFDWISYDFSVSRTGSDYDDPDDRRWTFDQEYAAFDPSTAWYHNMPLEEAALTATLDPWRTGLSQIYVFNTRLTERQTATQANFKMPFVLNDDISGYIKVGGKLRWLNRTNDENQAGRDGLQYGNASGPNVILYKLGQAFGSYVDTLVRKYGVLPIQPFLTNYTRSNFLDGRFPLGYVADMGILTAWTNALQGTDEYLRYAVGSRGRDYDGDEKYYAGYIMTEFNVGKSVTVLTGARYDEDYSLYNGQAFRETVVNNRQADPTGIENLQGTRRNHYWLPYLHLKFTLTDWLTVRLAGTQTLTRPDYIAYAPITSINSYQTYVKAANLGLKPALSKNYDISISVFENSVGLLTISPFYKEISNLIMYQTLLAVTKDVVLPPGVYVPASWRPGIAPQVDTYINNPAPAFYRGVELDWQTHFWYLPSVLQGLILNVNLTYIESAVAKHWFTTYVDHYNPGRIPIPVSAIKDTSRIARMPDQPAHIANITLGYDIEGFSARLTYLYQSDRTTYIDKSPAFDNFTDAYERWDLTAQQKIGENFQVFANFSNLTNRRDANFRGSELINPTYLEYYGFTMDIGVRFKL